MNIFINYPSELRRRFGIDDDVYKMISFISKNMNLEKYTRVIDTLGITPIILPEAMLLEGLGRQVTLVGEKSRMASISIHSDFEAYVKADTATKKLIFLDNIKRSAQIVKKRLRSKFDYESFIIDLDEMIKDL